MSAPSPLSRLQSLFEKVPGPSPWFLVPDTGWYRGPYVPSISEYSWQPVRAKFPRGSATALVGPAGPVALLGREVYVTSLDDSRLLIWYQNPPIRDAIFSPPVRLTIVEPGKLDGLGGDLQSLCDEMRDTKSKILLGGPPTTEIALSTLNVEDELTAEFPEDIRSIPELLILCHSSAIPVENGSVDLALMVVRPQEGRYKLFPQDWFNHSGADFGYEWVTRVVRNPETGQIHGEGFRIQPFVLDDSLRNLQR